MIIDNFFIEQFINPATAPGTPLTGITATINIWSVSGGTLTQVVTSESCTNLGNGFYGYVFTAMQPSTWYIYEIVPSATAYRTSAWVDYRMEKMDSNISDIRGGGGFSINYGAINSHVTKKVNELRDEIVKIPQQIGEGFNETNSHIDIAKGEITDKIESIEIPEAKLEEKEAKKVLKIVTDTSKTLKSYIDSEMKEKELTNETIDALQRFEMNQKMEMEKMNMEKMKKEEEDKKKEEELAKLAEEGIPEALDKWTKEQEEKAKEEKRKEIQMEIEELDKEKKEKEKELNSIK